MKMTDCQIQIEEKYVKVKDFKLYAKVFGEQKTKLTVVMDAGYGDHSKAWKDIAPVIAEQSDVVLYDRAGLGKSEKSPAPRTSDHMVDELKEMLAELNMHPPYLLVGHSFGGVNMRLFATEYPEEVSGLILVDSTPEDYREVFLPTMPAEFQKAYKDQFVYEGNYHEFMESLKLVKKSRKQLDIPLVVIAAGKKAHYSASSQQLWNNMQKELLTISTNNRYILAENSAHYIQYDEPAVVVEAIKSLF
ncbi:alpha/beta fold hydrolase [Rossellomorea aquimaris]|jgi:pimeloyl-ACP methyl ester carboxylesterase|uniref:Alpha/beta hydrolase n=1 Tax=Rossellomorea aquimaris TaxID=189382 RepID=A0A1J6W2F6_9BACI|nr:alpha/beta hydrolase [Rossellomorea aquimaris]OIU71778.1 alpha/beta hydrolase [Rossellomorea aquimaris]